MRVFILFPFLLITALFFISCDLGFDFSDVGNPSTFFNRSVNDTAVVFSEYPEYYCIDKTLKPDTTAFYFFDNKSDFENKFNMIYDHRTPKTIPSEEFKERKILSVVKLSNNYYELKINSISKKDNILFIDYSSEKKASNMTWTAIISLVITTPASFDHAVFYENGIYMGRIN
jgi:hypothetical protein